MFNTKFKKFLWLAILIIAILSASLLRIVPNYANKYGFEIVHLWDYNKYNQGYCLAENRILDKEELYKRAINEYMNKSKEIEQGAHYILKTEYGYHYEPEKIQFYLIDSFDSSNWYEFLKHNFANEKEISNKLETNATAIFNLYDYITVDTKNDIVGFKKPITFQGYLYLDKSFIIKDRYIIWLDIRLYNFGEHTKKHYYNQINRTDFEAPFENFDNCGNTIFNTKSSIKGLVEAIIHGG